MYSIPLAASSAIRDLAVHERGEYPDNCLCKNLTETNKQQTILLYSSVFFFVMAFFDDYSFSISLSLIITCATYTAEKTCLRLSVAGL